MSEKQIPFVTSQIPATPEQRATLGIEHIPTTLIQKQSDGTYSLFLKNGSLEDFMADKEVRALTAEELQQLGIDKPAK